MSPPEPAAEGAGLVLRGVVAGYGRRSVLQDLSLEAPAACVTGLIGPNGSGKTTVVRVASRGLAPRSGEVRVEGVDPYSIPARQAARLVAVVPQEVMPAFSYSVLEVVLMGRAPYRPAWGGGRADDWTAARRAMAVTNVAHLADRPLEELSGGERQRVILAQALAQDAPVLLLDEPTTHLDLRHVTEFLGTVRDLVRAAGRAVLAVFHDLNLASAICDRIAVLSAGRVVASGPPGSVLTPVLIREVFGIEADVQPAGAGGRPAVVLVPPLGTGVAPGGVRVHVVGGAGRAAGLLRSLAERGLNVSAGVLHQGDTDALVAERLNLLRVTVPPFSSVDARSAADCRKLMDAADVLIVCDVPVGPGNLENLRLVRDAAGARRGVATLLLDAVPVRERDFTGGEATRIWEALRGRCIVVSTEEALLAEVDRLLASSRPSA